MFVDETQWVMLQVQFLDKKPEQTNLLSEPLPRHILLSKCIELIPASIRTKKGENSWGLAEVERVGDEIIVCNLTVRPPLSFIAEETEPGVLESAHEPRFITNVVVHLKHQIIVINRSSDISRFARSANAYASIFFDLLKEALYKLQMDQHYELDVEPIAKTGSFLNWYKSLSEMTRLSFHYAGHNLPTTAVSLVDAIKNTANSFKNTFGSRTVDLAANDPNLVASDIEELDIAASRGQLKMRAKGYRDGIVTHWSSSTRRESEVLQIPFSEDERHSSNAISDKIGKYLNSYFNNNNRLE